MYKRVLQYLPLPELRWPFRIFGWKINDYRTVRITD